MQQRLKRTLTPIQEFFKTEASSGIVLLIATLLALVIANSGMNPYYRDLFQTYIRIGIGAFEINKPLILWVNDGLMAIFFLLIGLEIKRELLYGELSAFRSAVLPLIAAVGGAMIPAIIYFSLNSGGPYQDGWAIVIATDIAFALGVLALLGDRVPLWAKILLTATAVIDDLIAVGVIAFFYTETVNGTALIIAAIVLLILILLNRFNVHKLSPYLILGLILWIAVLKSGVHATVAGVLLGFTIPSSRFMDIEVWINKANEGVDRLNQSVESENEELRERALEDLEDVIEYAQSPLHRLEHELHPWVAYGIMPIFAFANAGVFLNADMLGIAIGSTLTWGIILGLVLGKQIGVFASVGLIHWFGGSGLPKGAKTYKIIYGLACLSGIGFTMSLFISGLSFTDEHSIELAKVGILLASLISGLIGVVVLSRIESKPG